MARTTSFPESENTCLLKQCKKHNRDEVGKGYLTCE